MLENERRDSPEESGLEAKSVSRRDFLKLAGAFGATIGLSAGLGGLVAACGSSGETATTASTAGGAATTAGGAATTAAGGATTTVSAGPATTAAAGASKAIKLGVVTDLSFPLEIDAKKLLDAYVPWLNANNPIKIGNDTYTFDMHYEDGKSNAETARAAVQKMISQDKVDFIQGDQTTSAWINITEAAKKLVTTCVSETTTETPNVKLVYNCGYWNAQSPIVWNWLVSNVQFQTVSGAFIDAVQGHAEAKNFQALAGAFGKTISSLDFYPASTQDFSALATKIAKVNADCFTTQGGGPVSDSSIFKSLRGAGYNGQYFNTVPLSPPQIAKVISLDYVQNMVGAVSAIDLDAPPAVAQQLKDLYTQMYGKWDNPDASFTMAFYLLEAGIRKAQSLDSQAVADAIGSGLEFDSADGHGKMISRPDLGNDRTVDCVYETTISKIQGDKAVVQEVIPIEKGTAEAQAYFQKIKK
jgi:ABC-type branched-subunit amino acid transport system substrate-binding protein